MIALRDADGRMRDHLYLVRLNPFHFQISVGYSPGMPLSLLEWQRRSQALMVVNGGFFTPENLAIGLVMVDRVSHGRSLQGYGGMLAILQSGPGLRVLADTPFDPGEPLLFALQSFPVLISGGRPSPSLDEQLFARRTAIGQDGEGRILFALAPWGGMTLSDLASFLASPDLGIDIAFNLDGGASTGLYLAEPEEGVPAFSLLPSVVLVHHK